MFRHIFLKAIVALAVGLSSLSLQALPSSLDFWRMECSPLGPSKKLLGKTMAKAKSAKSPIKKAESLIAAACQVFSFEWQKYEKALEAAASSGKPAPALSNQKSLSMLKNANNILNTQYKKNGDKLPPEGLYWLSYSYGLLGDAWIVNRADELIRIKKAGKWHQKAHMALAEYYFDAQNFAKAKEHYQDAIKGRHPLIKFYADYKSEWILLLEGLSSKNPDRAKMRALNKNVIYYNNTKSKKPLKAIAAMLKNDIYALLEEFSNINLTKNILTKINDDGQLASLLESIANKHIADKNYKEAYNVLSTASKEIDSKVKTFEIDKKMLALAFEMKNDKLVYGSLLSMKKKYLSEIDEEKDEKNKKDKKQKTSNPDKFSAELEGLFYDYAVTFDNQGRSANDGLKMKIANSLYKNFIAAFPKSSKLHEVKFYYGQTLFLQNKFYAAGDFFYKWLSEKKRNKYTGDSLQLMLSAAQTNYEQDKTDYMIPEPGKGGRKIKLPDSRKLFHDVLDLYMAYDPKNEHADYMIYESGSILYDFAHYREANKKYFLLIKRFPSSQYAESAAARVFEFYKTKKGKKAYLKLLSMVSKVRVLAQNQNLQFYFNDLRKASGKSSDKVVKKRKKRSEEKDSKTATEQVGNADPAQAPENSSTGAPAANTVSDNENAASAPDSSSSANSSDESPSGESSSSEFDASED